MEVKRLRDLPCSVNAVVTIPEKFVTRNVPVSARRNNRRPGPPQSAVRGRLRVFRATPRSAPTSIPPSGVTNSPACKSAIRGLRLRRENTRTTSRRASAGARAPEPLRTWTCRRTAANLARGWPEPAPRNSLFCRVLEFREVEPAGKARFGRLSASLTSPLNKHRHDGTAVRMRGRSAGSIPHRSGVETDKSTEPDVLRKVVRTTHELAPGSIPIPHMEMGPIEADPAAVP